MYADRLERSQAGASKRQSDVRHTDVAATATGSSSSWQKPGDAQRDATVSLNAPGIDARVLPHPVKHSETLHFCSYILTSGSRQSPLLLGCNPIQWVSPVPKWTTVLEFCAQEHSDLS